MLEIYVIYKATVLGWGNGGRHACDTTGRTRNVGFPLEIETGCFPARQLIHSSLDPSEIS